jgi:hypothetical protein
MREGAAGESRMLNRIRSILLAPSLEWPVIAQEKSEASALFLRYAAILALIPALARCIGASLVGWYAPVLPSLAGALVAYLAALAITYGLALIIDVLAPRFGGQRDFPAALKLAVYSATPVWIAGVFLLVPGLSFLVILGLHGAYLLWVGLPILMRVPDEKALPFTAVVAGCGLLVTVGLALIEAPLFSPPG